MTPTDVSYVSIEVTTYNAIREPTKTNPTPKKPLPHKETNAQDSRGHPEAGETGGMSGSQDLNLQHLDPPGHAVGPRTSIYGRDLQVHSTRVQRGPSAYAHVAVTVAVRVRLAIAAVTADQEYPAPPSGTAGRLLFQIDNYSSRGAYGRRFPQESFRVGLRAITAGLPSQRCGRRNKAASLAARQVH